MGTTVECPSGLIGKIRPIQVSDEPLTQDPKLIASGRLIYELCKRCWVETDNKGPYASKDPDWDSEVLQGDAFWVFMQLRRLTYGDSYEFTYKCEGCHKVASWVMMFSELDMQEPSEDGLDSVKTDGVVSEITSNGVSFQFKLLRAKDERRIKNYEDARNFSAPRATLASRLVSVGGQESSAVAIARWVEKLSSGEADELNEIMEAHECGTDTDIEVVCSNCMHEQEVQLPLGQGFFQRRRLRKKEKKKLRAVKRSRTPSSGKEGA